MRRSYYVLVVFSSTVLMTLFTFMSISDVDFSQELNNATNSGECLLKVQLEAEASYLSLYPGLLKCRLNFTSEWTPAAASSSFDYTQVANETTHEYRVNRAVIVYYPAEMSSSYEPEFKWFYESWLEMQIYEVSNWRTDIVVFISDDRTIAPGAIEFLESYNCSFQNRRLSRSDEPMCRLVAYVPLKHRSLDKGFNRIDNEETIPAGNLYKHLYHKVNIFGTDKDELREFYVHLKEKLYRYSYVDSILIAFDGHDELKDTYDLLVRSDIDVFLTPLFGKWLPKNCNDFYVGRGGYSDNFNMKRLRRIAFNLNLKYANIPNLGSTWYSTPEQFRLVSYLTLVSMLYLSSEEFSPPEKTFKQPLLWPYWHYGVLLLYGQNMAMNHLISTQQLNIVKLNDMIDIPTDSEKSVFKALHLHVYHGRNLFSKFSFKQGEYDSMTINDNLSTAKHYALNLALKSRISKNPHNSTNQLDKDLNVKTK